MKREAWIDFLKGVGILSVVVLHIIGAESGIIIKYFLSFHMFMFFSLSGYCMNEEKYVNNYKLFIRSRIKTLIYPYIFFSCINFIYSLFHSNDDFIHKIINNSFFQTTAWPAIWFLAALFIVENIAFFLIKFVKSDIVKIFICFALIAFSLIKWDNYFYYRQAMLCTLFWIMGYFLRKYLLLPKLKSLLYCVITMGIGFILCVINKTVLVGAFKLGIVPLTILSACFSTVGWCILAMLLDKRKTYVYSIIEKTGRNSLVILCTHMYFITLWRTVLEYFKISSMCDFFVLILTLLCEIPIIYIYRKKYFTHLFTKILGKKGMA